MSELCQGFFFKIRDRDKQGRAACIDHSFSEYLWLCIFGHRCARIWGPFFLDYYLYEAYLSRAELVFNTFLQQEVDVSIDDDMINFVIVILL